MAILGFGSRKFWYYEVIINMKTNRIWIYILILALVALAIYWLHQPHLKPSANPIQPPAAIAPPSQPSDVKNNAKPSPQQLTPAETMTFSNKAVEKRNTQWEEDINSKNVPVNFYGLCVDQNNQPISGVKIAMSVRHQEFSPTIGPHANYPSRQLFTDSDGRFEWSNSSDTGDILSLI